MIHQSLSGAWQMRELNSQEWLPAVVPGGTYLDLMAAGRIPDPFWGENETQLQWVADRDWEYQHDQVAVEGGKIAERKGSDHHIMSAKGENGDDGQVRYKHDNGYKDRKKPDDR